ncbi:kinase-like domain-containing protein [Gigaspora rosea]|uniref:Kinase-like domain-containing protein n=1 Tax=Gigaspora rosea TaxID=44941 RepID=A0A397W2S9_9GLOM|nr:kinase-like domain-containing protein [Gigaspora rosea]
MSNYNNSFVNQQEKIVSSLDITQMANNNTQLYLEDNKFQDLLSQDSINEIIKEMCNLYNEKKLNHKYSSLILDILEQFLIKKKQNPIDIINYCLNDQINPMMQIILADCYRFGKWFEKDEYKAFIYYQKSAGMGSALGFFEVGVCYFYGIGVEKDDHKAFIYCQKSVEMGNPNGIALACLGFSYRYGIGVEKDEHKAFSYFQKAAEMGNANGTYWVGNCYQYGIGVEKDENKAFIYYRKLAEMGDPNGMSSVAECYRCGFGVIRDLDKAKYWYQSKYPLSWISFDEFKNIKMIGRGGFATVYRAEWCDKIQFMNGTVAFKLFHESNNYHKEFIRELKAYCDIGLKDPTFLRCFGVSKDEVSKDYILVMEYALEGCLRKNLRAIVQMDWRDKLNLLQCIAYDLLIIHSQDLIHRDLHSGNILLNSLKSAYIADLGLSITANIQSKSNLDGIYGILPFIAPEVLSKHPYTKESDIYSFEWQNNEIILSELTESDKKLQNIKNEDMQIDIESDYRSKFISFNSSYKYQGSKLCELEIPNI